MRARNRLLVINKIKSYLYPLALTKKKLTVLPFSPVDSYELLSAMNLIGKKVRIVETAVLRGKTFEDEVIRSLDKIGYDCLRGIRSRLLIKGLSGVTHEKDAIFVKRGEIDKMYFFECKWRQHGPPISKNDVMIFNQKSLDIFFRKYVDKVLINNLYRIFISAQPLSKNAYKFCLTHGILVIQPFKIQDVYPSNIMLLPPIDWCIHHLTTRTHIQKSRKNVKSLLTKMFFFRKKIFRNIDNFPKPFIHDGDRLYSELFQLVWETLKMVDI